MLAAITWDAVDWFMLKSDRGLESCLTFSQVRFDVVCARYSEKTLLHYICYEYIALVRSMHTGACIPVIMMLLYLHTCH